MAAVQRGTLRFGMAHQGVDVGSGIRALAVSFDQHAEALFRAEGVANYQAVFTIRDFGVGAA